MTCGFDLRRGRRGLTLIEILVASALFGLFTGMVAGALIMAHRSQDASVSKLDAVRRATLALDLLVRDVEAAQYVSDVTMNGATPPAKAGSPAQGTVPVGLNELQITRYRQYPTSTYLTSLQRLVAGYWYDQGDPLVEGDGMIRRVLYDSYSSPLAPLAGEHADGRVLVRDVRDFRVSSYALGGLTMLESEIWLGTLGNPVRATVALVPTVAP
jgi:prepilin-type N-terminal cleavage/methylation domain-containing protein